MVQIIPPVHPNCRCVIGEDGVWTDAEDARVCEYCMVLGASWNFSFETSGAPSGDEIDEILDTKFWKDFKKALEKDVAVANKVVEQLAPKATEGILANKTFPISTEVRHTVAIELEINQVKSAMKQDFGTEFVPFGVRKRPKFIEVLVWGLGSITLVKQKDRYIVRKNSKIKYSRTADSNADLLLALLFAAALAENENEIRKNR